MKHLHKNIQTVGRVGDFEVSRNIFLTAAFGVPCTWEENAGENIERGKLFDIEGVVLRAVGERIPRVFAVDFLWFLYISNCDI